MATRRSNATFATGYFLIYGRESLHANSLFLILFFFAELLQLLKTAECESGYCFCRIQMCSENTQLPWLSSLSLSFSLTLHIYIYVYRINNTIHQASK